MTSGAQVAAQTPAVTAPVAPPPPTCLTPPSAREAKKVLDALFPRYLTRASQCGPQPAVGTWGEVDRVQASNYAAGQFVPAIVRRARFPPDLDSSEPSWRGVVYEVQIDNCQGNTFGHVVRAAFLDAELVQPHPKPVSREESHPLPDAARPLCADAESGAP